MHSSDAVPLSSMTTKRLSSSSSGLPHTGMCRSHAHSFQHVHKPELCVPLQTADVNLIAWVSLDRCSADSGSMSCASGEDTGSTWASETCYMTCPRHLHSVPGRVSHRHRSPCFSSQNKAVFIFMASYMSVHPPCQLAYCCMDYLYAVIYLHDHPRRRQRNKHRSGCKGDAQHDGPFRDTTDRIRHLLD